MKKLMKRTGPSISKLNPRIEGGLLRAGACIGRAPFPYEFKHPVILPYRHHVTDLIVRVHHHRMGHPGQELILSSLRQKYWILKGWSALRRVLNKCSDCQERKAKAVEHFMAELQDDRVTSSDPPFTYVGIDCVGTFRGEAGAVTRQEVRLLIHLLYARSTSRSYTR